MGSAAGVGKQKDEPWAESNGGRTRGDKKKKKKGNR